MKKIVCFCLILAFVAGCFSGCGGPKWEPERVSSDLVPYVERTIEIIDQYLAFEITTEEATAAVEEVGERMDVEAIYWSEVNEYPALDRNFASRVHGLMWYGIDGRTDTELKEMRDIMLYSIGKPTSGKRNFPKPETDTFELGYSGEYYDDSDFYDYMCGFDPEDIAEIAKQELENLRNFPADVQMTIYYSCYDQLVFSVYLYKTEEEYRIRVHCVGEEDWDENLTPEEMETQISEVSSYFTGP